MRVNKTVSPEGPEWVNFIKPYRIVANLLRKDINYGYVDRDNKILVRDIVYVGRRHQRFSRRKRMNRVFT